MLDPSEEPSAVVPHAGIRAAAEGMPVSAQTVWQILSAQGLPRLPRRDDSRRGSPTRLDLVKAGPLPGWPADTGAGL